MKMFTSYLGLFFFTKLEGGVCPLPPPAPSPPHITLADSTVPVIIHEFRIAIRYNSSPSGSIPVL